jgi:hypothetical protein
MAEYKLSYESQLVCAVKPASLPISSYIHIHFPTPPSDYTNMSYPRTSTIPPTATKPMTRATGNLPLSVAQLSQP